MKEGLMGRRTMKTEEHAAGHSISIVFAICLDFNEPPRESEWRRRSRDGKCCQQRGSFTLTKSNNS